MRIYRLLAFCLVVKSIKKKWYDLLWRLYIKARHGQTLIELRPIHNKTCKTDNMFICNQKVETY